MHIRKCAYRNCNNARPALNYKGERRSTFRAKSIRRSMTAVCNSFPYCGFSRNSDIGFWPPRLSCKRASGTSLALKAMAYRNAYRLTLTSCRKLPTSASRRSIHHIYGVQYVFVRGASKPSRSGIYQHCNPPTALSCVQAPASDERAAPIRNTYQHPNFNCSTSLINYNALSITALSRRPNSIGSAGASPSAIRA
jgi:hypothetical protein